MALAKFARAAIKARFLLGESAESLAREYEVAVDTVKRIGRTTEKKPRKRITWQQLKHDRVPEVDWSPKLLAEYKRWRGTAQQRDSGALMPSVILSNIK